MSFMEPLEKSFNSTKVQNWVDNNKHHSFTVSLLYVVLTYSGQYFMRNKKPFSLKLCLFGWNAFLALFSIMGALRTFSQWKHSVFGESWRFSICDSGFYEQERTALWAFLFAASKLFELGDTSFLVLRKRPIIFLHVYHHVTVFIYCAYSYADFVSSGKWYGAMNYFIHSIMYAYYAFTALKITRVPKVINISITSLQLIQMVLGLVVTFEVLRAKYDHYPCSQSTTNAILAGLMYLSYFVLFLDYFKRTYGKDSTKFAKSKSS